MKYDVDALLTVTVEAEKEDEAKRKALEKITEGTVEELYVHQPSE